MPQGIVALGDSITFQFPFTKVGGCTVENAGFPGWTVGMLADAAPVIFHVTKPRVVHAMAGTNNLPVSDVLNEWSSLQANFERIITAGRAAGAKVVLWAILPIAAKADAQYPNSRRVEVNAAIAAAVTAKGGPAAGAYYEWWATSVTAAQVAGPDGIHPSAAGQELRRRRMELWVQSLARLGWWCR